MYMSANNINMIISGTAAIVRVRFVDPWATNNTLLVKLDAAGQLVRFENSVPKFGNRTNFFHQTLAE